MYGIPYSYIVQSDKTARWTTEARHNGCMNKCCMIDVLGFSRGHLQLILHMNTSPYPVNFPFVFTHVPVFLVMQACVELANSVREMRTEIELLPQCWEHVFHIL